MDQTKERMKVLKATMITTTMTPVEIETSLVNTVRVLGTEVLTDKFQLIGKFHLVIFCDIIVHTKDRSHEGKGKLVLSVNRTEHVVEEVLQRQ